MNSQTTDTLLMIRPVGFHGNEQTAVNNFFQKTDNDASYKEIQRQALKEFEAFVSVLESNGLNVIVVEGTIEPSTPDAIFPNNWISFHENGEIFTYPMFAENRRLERRDDVIQKIAGEFIVIEVVRLDPWEEKGHFLEGTGSLVLDRSNKIAYVALSDRAHLPVIQDFQERTGFQVVTFHSDQHVKGKNLPVYHTNVMMYVGEGFAVVCLESIDDGRERKQLVETLEDSRKEIIEISEEQLWQFAGNGLQVRNSKGDLFVVMSSSAFHSWNQNQRKALEKNGEIIHSPLDTIEFYGGGSARCMMAEIFLRRKDHV